MKKRSTGRGLSFSSILNAPRPVAGIGTLVWGTVPGTKTTPPLPDEGRVTRPGTKIVPRAKLPPTPRSPIMFGANEYPADPPADGAWLNADVCGAAAAASGVCTGAIPGTWPG